MGFQKVEFEFPDGDEDDKVEVDNSSALEVDVGEGKNTQGKEIKKPVAKEIESEVEVEIVDDTPKDDQGRKPSDPPEEVTDDELESYSEKVRNRIKHFTKGYHDERRDKEKAIREREELELVTKQLMGEINTLKDSGNKSQTALLQQAKKNADYEYSQAKVAYKKAYDEGDGDKLLEAQEALSNAKTKVDKVASYKIAPLQQQENSVEVDSNESSQKPPAQQQGVAVDERAAGWAKKNTWFNTDSEMTSYALGLHNRLVKEEGLDPKSDDYYERIDSRMRQLFPERFEDTGEKPDKQQRSTNVVAPASRSTTPKKIRLTQSQVRIAKRLGLTPEQYAKQVALDMRKNG